MERDYVDQCFSLIEKNRVKYEDMLKNEKKSKGSGEGSHKSLDWATQKLRSAGAAIEPCEAKSGTPPLLRASIGKFRDKKTILIYGHLKASTSKKDDTKLLESGVADAKGPLTCLFTALEVFQNLKIQLPVNLRFLLEAMGEKDADSFKEYIHRNSGSIFYDVDCVCVLDNRPNFYYGTRPLLCWALRGCCRFELTVECASKNLHSGDNGGAIQEAMTDTVSLLSSLTNSKGDILISGITNDVFPLSPQEEKDYNKANFDVCRYKQLTGANVLLHKEDKKRVLLHMTRFPSISIHSIESGTDTFGNCGNIPAKVTAKFSIRTVPNQTENSIQDSVNEHLNKIMTSINSSNKLTLKMTESSPPWQTNPKQPHIQACLKALKRTYKEDAELIREGCTIPIVQDLQENCGKDVLLLPIGRSKCHTPVHTEINIFLDGTKIICAFFYEMSRIAKI